MKALRTLRSVSSSLLTSEWSTAPWIAEASASFSSAPIVDQMISYVRQGPADTQTDQAVDILKGGLQMPGCQDGLGAARLHLEICRLEMDRGGWASAMDRASLAQTALRKEDPSARPAAADDALVSAAVLQLRCASAAGSDAGLASSAAAAQEVSSGLFRQPGRELHCTAARLLGATQTAVTDFLSRSRSNTQTPSSAREALSLLQQQRPGGEAAAREALQSDGAAVASLGYMNALANLQGAVIAAIGGGDNQLAAELATKSADAIAEVDADAAKSGPSILTPLSILNEVRADALLCKGQVLLRDRAFDAAEEALTEALKAAESVSGDRHPRVGLVLGATASLYALTKRISFAEGLFRESLKLLKVEPELTAEGLQGMESFRRTPYHVSASGLPLFRFGQMLDMIANRKHHGTKLMSDASDAWRVSFGDSRPDIQTVLGDLYGSVEKKRPTLGLTSILYGRTLF